MDIDKLEVANEGGIQGEGPTEGYHARQDDGSIKSLCYYGLFGHV